MAELLNKERIKSVLHPILQPLLDDTLAAASGAALQSAVLYGSAVAADYAHGRSDINVYFVFDKVDLPLLKSLRDVFKKHYKKMRSNPVTLDEEYIKDSTDVFPMEFLEWKENGLVFYGRDPLAALEISSANLRLSIEQNLRGKRLRMVQSFFEMDPRRGRMMPFLFSVLPNFVVVARNMLRLMDVAVTSDKSAMLGALERKTGVELTAFKRLIQVKADDLRVGTAEAEIMFKQFLEEIDALIMFIDRFDAGGKS